MSGNSNSLFTFHQTDGGGGTIQFRLEMREISVDGSTVKLPAKIGDGNFGAVFAADSEPSGRRYALKVIYQHAVPKDDEPLPLNEQKELERVRKELKIGTELPQRLQKFVKGNLPQVTEADSDFPNVARRPGDHIVLPLAYSEEFNKFTGRKQLQDLDIELSPYAYLMDRYDGSLKDLVEGQAQHPPGLLPQKDAAQARSGRNDNDDGAGRKQKPVVDIQVANATEPQGPGYARLEDVPVVEKERSAVPVLEQIARGLQMLHAASFRHQDIKPANVYFMRDGRRLRFRLGDLGFLRPTDDPTIAGSAVAKEPIGIGTRHYRSIEQIDFCDTAECDVTVDSTGREALLVTRDPKFAGTNIRPGDFAYFAKSASRRLHPILSIKKDDPAKGAMNLRIEIIRAVDQTTGKPERSPVVADTNTQVSFLKNPTAKTDLFGLGAILYDIISGGGSPERFYELLRRFDVEGIGIEERIVSLYDTWKVGLMDDADVGAIFGRVNTTPGEHVHVDVVRFLLKSMMSNAKDSFYVDFGFDKAEDHPAARHKDSSDKRCLVAVSAWRKVLDKIKKLERQLGATEYSEHATNVLTRCDWRTLVAEEPACWEPPRYVDGQGVPFEAVLRAYRDGKPPLSRSQEADADCGDASKANTQRLVLCSALIRKLTSRLSLELTTPHHGSLDMYSLAQEHLSVTSDSVNLRRHVLEGDEGQLVARMRARDPLLTRIRPYSSRFEPIWWRHGTRRVLAELVDPEKPAGATIAARIRFADFSAWRVAPQSGDFILPGESGSPLVFRIVNVEGNDGTARLRVFSTSGRQETPIIARALRDGYLVKNPDRVDYYAGMLGIYMFHILVSRGDAADGGLSDFPQSIYQKAMQFPVSFKTPPSSHRPTLRRTSKKRIPALSRHTCDLAVWLVLGGYNDSKLQTDERTKWTSVRAQITRWCDRVDRLFPEGYVTNLVYGPDLPPERTAEPITPEDWELICSAYMKTAA